jgi:hypothetical protein
MVEVWEPVPGYEGLYDVSDAGRVRSHPRPRTPGGILRQTVERSTGYLKVELCRDGVQSSLRVHRLVALAFLRTPGPREHVRHLNGDKLDNQLTNLAIGSVSENAQDLVRHGRHNNARKTECKKGHPFSGVNARQRVCIICIRESKREYAARKRAILKGAKNG